MERRRRTLTPRGDRVKASPQRETGIRGAAAGWETFRAPEPTTLAELARRGSAELPFLGSALRRLLEELLDATDGLSGTERRALRAIAGGARTHRPRRRPAQRAGLLAALSGGRPQPTALRNPLVGVPTPVTSS